MTSFLSHGWTGISHGVSVAKTALVCYSIDGLLLIVPAEYLFLRLT